MSTTCKFFLQGTCKFGDHCKFSHEINDLSSQIQGTSIMRQNVKPPVVDTNLLVKAVVTDMTNAEKGGHWLLSSYAPFKDKPCFPGFENRSFEEVRFGYYEAMKSGAIEQFKQQLQVSLHEAAMKMKALQNPTNEIVSMLIQIYNTPVANQNASTGAFSTPQSGSIFVQNQAPFVQNQQPSTSIFAVANQNIFGNATQPQSLFADASQKTTPFGGGAQPVVNKSIFSGGQQVFNNNQQSYGAAPNKSIFGNQNFAPQPSNNQNSPFGGQNTTFNTQNKVFNQQGNMFTSQMQNLPFQTQTMGNSPFGNQGQTPSSSIFGIQNQQQNFPNISPTIAQPPPFSGAIAPQQSIFAPAPNQQNIVLNTLPFQQQQPQSNIGNTPFNVAAAPTSVFGQQTSIFGGQPTTIEQKLNNSVFGQSQIQRPSLFGGGKKIDEEAYSKLEDLSENDIKCFESESFEFGKIPEKPPTAQMCLQSL